MNLIDREIIVIYNLLKINRADDHRLIESELNRDFYAMR